MNASRRHHFQPLASRERPGLAPRPLARLPKLLEVQLAAELHRTRCVRACSLAKASGSDPGIYEPEVGVVEQVEGFCAHLETDVFGKPEVFHQAQINLFHTGR